VGTYVLADSITGEPIKENEQVVAILLTNALSEQKSSYLFASTDERYKLAHLPVKGIWNGNCIVANDDQSLAVKSALYATNIQVDTFEELQRQLYTKSTIEVPDGWSKRLSKDESPPIPVTFSMFVAKPASLALLVDNPAFVSRMETNLTAERAKVDVLVNKLIEVLRGKDSPDSDVRDDTYFVSDDYLKAIFFNNTEREISGDEIPLTAGAMARSEGCGLSSRLGFFLETQHMFRSAARYAFEDRKALPDGYDAVFTAMYEAQTLTMAMKFLSVPLVPAARRYSPHMDKDRIELLQAMLLDEVSRLAGDACDDRDREKLKVLDDVLGPLRKKISDVVKRRNDLEAKIEQSEARLKR
jgi:hypothetical protein